ncbi:MAG: tetratricopeptide repeat protein [Bacteroidota bacterium]|nr:tetratricopeptide repeat protein [Bacteroidota bacterium]
MLTKFRHILFFCCFIAISISGYTQVDSLNRVIKDPSKPDSLKCQALFGVISYYLYNDLDSAAAYSQQLYDFADKINSVKWKANALVQKGIVNYNRKEGDAAIKLFKEAFNLFSTIKNYKGQGNCYNNIGLCYQASGNTKQSISFYEKSLTYYNLCPDRSLKGAVYNNLSIIYIKQHSLETAKTYIDSALSIYEKSGMQSKTAIPLMNLALLHSEKNDYPKALEGYLKALKILKENNDIVNQAGIYNNMGNIYTNTQNYPKAIVYLKESIELKKQLSDSDGLASSYINIALNYRYQKNMGMHKAYIDTTKIYMEPDIDNEVRLFVMEELTYYHAYRGNYDSVIVYFDEFKRISQKLSNDDITSQLSEMSIKYKTSEIEKTAKLSAELAQARNEQLKKEKKIKNFLIIFLVVVCLLLLVIFIALRKVRAANILIRKQQDQLKESYGELQVKNHIIEEKQKEILDSINYAKRIQDTVFASTVFVNEYLPENFIFFRPKDIVSGDFYWATEKNEFFYLAVCDSTGHGVPGAFMSLLNISFLNEAINEENIHQPDKIFNYTREKLISTVSKGEQKDGFDGILLCINTITREITYAAANNAPVLVSGDVIQEMPANKMPVGKGERVGDFDLHSIQYKRGDMLYLYSDGFADQFGGPKGKKFKYKPLNEMVRMIANVKMAEQEELLNSKFLEWKGDLEQVDDVLLVGIRL